MCVGHVEKKKNKVFLLNYIKNIKWHIFNVATATAVVLFNNTANT